MSRARAGHDSKHAVKTGFASALTKNCVKHGMLLLSTGYAFEIYQTNMIMIIMMMMMMSTHSLTHSHTHICVFLFILCISAHETVRFIPPLISSEEDIDLGLDIFEKAIQDTIKEQRPSSMTD